MTSTAWNASSARFPDRRGALLAATLALAGVLVLVPRDARACGGGGDDDAPSSNTFDPTIAGAGDLERGLFYDPSTPFEPCADCPRQEMLADWARFLGPTVTPEDWAKILFDAKEEQLNGLLSFLQGKRKAPPAGFETNSITRTDGATRGKAIHALFFVRYARKVEPLADLGGGDEGGASKPRPKSDATALLGEGATALAARKDPFLRQRYAFQLTRLRFYQRDWPGAVSFVEQNATDLDGPSQALKWRARYYVAGAHARLDHRALANLELARVHDGLPSLATATAQDFRPLEQKDWQETLALARTVREKTALWRLVGIKHDGVVAMNEIVALDPASRFLVLLALRELSKVGDENTKALQPLEKVALRIAAAPGADRPWFFRLLAGHIAALRGDAALARKQLAEAARLRPGDPLIANQIHATTALALIGDGKPGPGQEQALLGELGALDPKLGATLGVTSLATRKLAEQLSKAGRTEEAELLRPGQYWKDSPAFIEALIRRLRNPTTPLERFEVKASRYTVPQLQRSLALAHVLKGDLAAADRVFRTPGIQSEKLGTDPFVIHTRDCHDCDQEKYANAPWTQASFVARLVELSRAAQGTGEKAARAAFDMGNGLYNITKAGNARSFFSGSPRLPTDTRAAEAAYKRAFDLTSDRELKARAAFMAAKAELARLAADEDMLDTLPVPTTWFPVVKTFSDTRYYKEILAECGHFKRWSRRH